MATCDICGNEFKNNSGLSGHKQLAHRFESADGSALERSPERFVKRSDQRLVQQFEERLLEQIQLQLDRLEELERASTLIDQVKAAAIEEVHKHGMSDPECPGCLEVVRKSLNAVEQKARDETTAYYEAIPGVTQLRETWQRLKAEGKDPEELITITGLRDGETAEDVIRRAVRKASEEDDMITII